MPTPAIRKTSPASASDLPRKPSHPRDGPIPGPPKPLAAAVAGPSVPAPIDTRVHPSADIRESKRDGGLEHAGDVRAWRAVAGP
jgi:hypothetical protein